MRFRGRELAFLGIALASCLALAGIGIDAGQEPKKLRIIYSNDTLGYLEACG